MNAQITIPFARRATSLIGSVIDSSTALLAQQEHDIVRFAMGAPGEDLIPVAELDASYARAAEGRYNYGQSEGEPRLREQILKLSANSGVHSSDDRILVTTGGMQGLDIAFKLFVDPGDLVIIEAPTYTNGYATAMSYGADVLAVPVDHEGMMVEQLPALVEAKGKVPKAIYTVPNFQNPSGVTMSRARREELLRLAEDWGAIIIDDDPYGSLRFSGTHEPGFLELVPEHPLVFGVRTFSKIVAPGLRTGWIDVDPMVRERAIAAKQAMDTCSQVPAQHAVAQFLEDGHLVSHIARLLPLYAERKDVMRAELDRVFGSAVRTTNPDGGFFLWVTFEGELAGIDTEELFPRALEEGVAYIPGPAFTPDGSMRDSLRLCFATSSPERIHQGVGRLAAAVKAGSGQGSR